MDHDAIDAAIDGCYDAVFDRETWPDALHALARSVNSACAMFYPENPSGRLLTVPASRDYGDFLEDYVANGWYENHYRAERGWPLLRAGRPVVIEHDLATDEERRHLVHYNDLYLRWGFPGFAIVGFQIDGESWGVPLIRAGSQGHFERSECAELASLAPHFRRMIRLSERITQDRASTGLTVLDTSKGAALLVGADGKVVTMNRHAERLLGDGLTIRNGILETGDQGARAGLDTLMTYARSMASPSTPPPAPVVVRRREARPLVVEAFPLQGLLSDLFTRFGVLLLVTDLDERCGPDAQRLRELLGLTPAEARLVASICRTHALPETARELGVSLHTARTQIKSVFAKTATGRQAELVTLANTLGTIGEKDG